MDTSDMEVFSVLCDCKSVSRAAKNLFMSQQGVSSLLQRIEKELGVELFKRTRSGLELTKYGEVVKEHVESILTDYRAMQNTLEQIKKEDSRLFVTMDLGIFAILTSKPFLDFKTSHPDVEFIMQEHTPKTNERLLVEEAADICLALAPHSTEVFDVMPIYQVSGAVLMDKENELANRDALYVEDLKGRPLLAFGSATYYPYLRACRKAGFEPNMTVSGIELQDPRPYVRGTDGLCPSFYGILPEISEDDGLVIVPFKTDLLWSICTVTKKGRKQSTLCRKFVEELIDFVNTEKIINGEIVRQLKPQKK
jgi:DNA-binding transcriptional LysR family regulator